MQTGPTLRQFQHCQDAIRRELHSIRSWRGSARPSLFASKSKAEKPKRLASWGYRRSHARRDAAREKNRGAILLVSPPSSLAAENIKLIKTLQRAGFNDVRIRGSHHFLRHPDGRVTVVPVHTGETIGPGLLAKILRDCELSRDELRELLDVR